MIQLSNAKTNKLDLQREWMNLQNANIYVTLGWP